MAFIIYLILGYWAVGKTLYANSIRFGTLENLFARRLAYATMLGWILIPIAVLKVLFGRK